MCGFVGQISKNNIDNEKLLICNNYLICRGPDDLSSINRNFKNFNFSAIFNRLAIIDLNENANQPMEDDEGNILLFNGEIFNHKDLRKDLINNGITFKTSHADSEVVLKGLGHYGINFVNNLTGQFSIFYFSNKKNTCYLIRDRLGQKPLFYVQDNENLLFSSNLKTLIKLKGDYQVSETEFNEYIFTGVVSSPKTIFKNFKKLKPGEIITFELNDQIKASSKIYWKPEDHLGNKKFDKDLFFSLLNDSLMIRGEADVQVAHFLSGGLDSTTLIKLNSAESRKKINTFNVSSKDSKYDESYWAQKVVDKYNSNHITVEVSAKIEIDLITETISSFDEPYSDPSTIPSYLISKKISKFYKAAISGDGGDELLGGYKRLYKSINRIKISNRLVSLLFNLYPFWLGSGYILNRNNNLIDKSYISHFIDFKLKNILTKNSFICYPELNFNIIPEDEYKSILLFDYKYYLPEMMMLKVDRSSMANSLEVRSPFVDHRLVELILNSDLSNKKIHDSKKILKDFLSEDFPSDFLYRPKQGFVFELEDWVFSNKEMIYDTIKNSQINYMFNLKNLKKLFFFKSRINALRIWRVYFICVYLDSV